MKIAKYVIFRPYPTNESQKKKLTIGQQRFGQPCIIELVLLFASYEEITAV